MITLYFALIALVAFYQNCFMFKPIYLKGEAYGLLAFWIAVALAIPIVIVGGWRHLLIYLGVHLGAYILFLFLSSAAWKKVMNKLYK